MLICEAEGRAVNLNYSKISFGNFFDRVSAPSVHLLGLRPRSVHVDLLGLGLAVNLNYSKISFGNFFDRVSAPNVHLLGLRPRY